MHLMSAVAMATRLFLHAAVAVLIPPQDFGELPGGERGGGGGRQGNARAAEPPSPGRAPSLPPPPPPPPLRPFPWQRLAGTEPLVPRTLRSPRLALVTPRQMLSSGGPSAPHPCRAQWPWGG